MISFYFLIYIILAIVVSTGFYWLRCRRPCLFGVIEILVGLLVIHLTFHPGYNTSMAQEISYPELILGSWAGTLAGVYIFVRGMDNIDKGPPPGWLRLRWNKLFHGGARGTP